MIFFVNHNIRNVNTQWCNCNGGEANSNEKKINSLVFGTNRQIFIDWENFKEFYMAINQNKTTKIWKNKMWMVDFFLCSCRPFIWNILSHNYIPTTKHAPLTYFHMKMVYVCTANSRFFPISRFDYDNVALLVLFVLWFLFCRFLHKIDDKIECKMR